MYFRKLKKDLAKKLKEKFNEIHPEISKWKGREIELFQDDLERCVKGRISEKWFYTHLKAKTSKLPRVDILDLLSQYLGYEGWIDFKHRSKISKAPSRRNIMTAVFLPLILILAIIFVYFLLERQYNISVVDAYSNQPINKEELVVTQLFDDQSPREIPADEDGTFTLISRDSEFKFVIHAPYHHSDTIVRKVSGFTEDEIIRLLPNDYALIIHYLSGAKTEDWQRRRVQLSVMIADDAKIIQMSEYREQGIEMYNKQEFINKLTIPVKSLGHIEIIDIRHEGNQISHLRFIQKKGVADE